MQDNAIQQKDVLPNRPNQAVNSHQVNSNEAHTSYDDGAPPGLFRDVPAYTPMRKLKIVTIGAGFSGLLFAHKLQHQYAEMQSLVEHKIIESRDEIGGTWLVNTYPGIQCDVPAHIYVKFLNPHVQAYLTTT